MIISATNGDIDILVRTLAGEARGERQSGQRRVVYVVLTRAFWGELEDGHPEREWWGNGITAACKCPKQFSCWNGGKDTDFINALLPTDGLYKSLTETVRGIINTTAPSYLAFDKNGKRLTHYKVHGTEAEWDEAVKRLNLSPLLDGKHEFFALGPNA